MKNIMYLFSVCLLSACTQNQPVDLGDKTTAQTQIETVKIEKGQLVSEIKLPGQLKAFERVDIYPRVNGFIKDINVDRGSQVHQGQVLMVLEAPEVEHELQSANDKLLQAQENLNASRDKYLRLKLASKKPGSVSQIDLETATARFQADSAFQQSEKANVNAVQAMRDYLVVKAPFDGVITERNVHPGTLVGPNFKMDNKPLLILQNNRKLRLEVFVPEKYVENLNLKNKKISFTTGAIQGKIFTANITRTSEALNDSYRSEALEADVINTDNTFMPGMYVETKLSVTSNVTAYVVPANAVITTTERRYVITDDNGKAHFIPVTTGVSAHGKTEVYGNFTGNESVVIKPAAEMKEGMVLK